MKEALCRRGKKQQRSKRFFRRPERIAGGFLPFLYGKSRFADSYAPQGASFVCSAEKDPDYYFLVSILDQSYWVLGTAVGSVLGSVLRFNTEGIDFALTALFLTVFTDQWLHGKQHFSAVCGVVVSAACLLLFGPDRFLIPAMLIIAAALVSKGYLKKEVKTDG